MFSFKIFILEYYNYMKISKHISKTYDEYILELVNNRIPIIRKRTYLNKYFLEHFKLMLNNINNWQALSYLKTYPNGIKYHYKYIQQIYSKWVSYTIFKDAYTNMINDNYFKLKHIKKCKTLNLFIDCSYIVNKYGVESITTNPEYRKKKVTKISAICDQFKNILSIIPIHTQSVISKYHNKQIKSFPHDIKSVQKTLSNIHLRIPKYVNVNIVGDKGYVTKELFLLNNKSVPIISPIKNNQKKKNNKRNKILLSRRNVIENSFSNIKKNEQIMIRKCKNINEYMGFVYLGMLKDFNMRNISIPRNG